MPETRQRAPGDLGVLQDFLNSAQLGGAPGLSEQLAAEVRARRAGGESQAAIASGTGLSRMLVSALARGVPAVDALDSPQAATQWIEERVGRFKGYKVDDVELARLLLLRANLRELTLANAGGDVAASADDTLDTLASTERPRMRFAARNAVRLESATVFCWLLTVAFDAMRDGTWTRLKRCTGDGCPHVFYDSSRNRSGAWCAMAVCGNRRKVRAYQERRRGGKPT